jgi:ATP-dependent DNA ligase
MSEDRPKREGIMLAYPVEDDARVARLGESFIAQPKLNGDRCHVEWFHGDPVLISSYGNMFEGLSHITAALKALPQPAHFDGELYVHGWHKDKIHSAVSRKTNASEDAKYIELHIFDIKASIPQLDRIGMLQDMQFNWPLYRVNSYRADLTNWRKLAYAFVRDNYEGIILRDFESLYVEKRSTKMLKYKPTYKDTYEIVEVREAINKHGEPKDMLGAFFVASKTAENDGFWIGAGKLTHEERIRLWKLRDELPGKMLVVKHEKLTTSGGVPLCCVALDVKNL